MKKLDFTAYQHPVLAVACPTCRQKVGSWCKRPSGHRAWGGGSSLHKARKMAADDAWEKGKYPPITQVGPGKFIYDKEVAR